MLRVCLVIWRVLLGVVAMGESGAPDAGPCGAWSWQLAAQLLELGMLPCLGRGYDGFIDARGHATWAQWAGNAAGKRGEGSELRRRRAGVQLRNQKCRLLRTSVADEIEKPQSRG